MPPRKHRIFKNYRPRSSLSVAVFRRMFFIRSSCLTLGVTWTIGPVLHSSPYLPLLDQATASAISSCTEPTYRGGHLPRLSCEHLSCFDFLGFQHKPMLFLVLPQENRKTAVRPSACSSCWFSLAFSLHSWILSVPHDRAVLLSSQRTQIWTQTGPKVVSALAPLFSLFPWESFKL